MINKEEYYIEIKNLNIIYKKRYGIKNVNIGFKKNKVTSIIGRSGCGKSTLIKSINRMNDLVQNCNVHGSIIFNGQDILNDKIDLVDLRKNIGMVFQHPTPFPKSIFDNIAYGVKIHGMYSNKNELYEIVKKSLIDADLWEEVEYKLHESALSLSGGQQQRMCIARTLAIKPKVILMDEPCSALDPLATAKIEDLIRRLKEKVTIILVTHSMNQAARVSDYVAFFDKGELIEYNKAKELFTSPVDKRTLLYITGRKS